MTIITKYTWIKGVGNLNHRTIWAWTGEGAYPEYANIRQEESTPDMFTISVRGKRSGDGSDQDFKTVEIQVPRRELFELFTGVRMEVKL